MEHRANKGNIGRGLGLELGIKPMTCCFEENGVTSKNHHFSQDVWVLSSVWSSLVAQNNISVFDEHACWKWKDNPEQDVASFNGESQINGCPKIEGGGNEHMTGPTLNSSEPEYNLVNYYGIYKILAHF